MSSMCRSLASQLAEGKLVKFTEMAIHQPDGVCV
ncbi:MAG: hypothetical protein ACJAZF_004155, partial [Granulosicoccus sp.]